MSEHVESLLVLSTDQHMCQESMERLEAYLSPIAESMGARPVVLTGGMQLGIHADIKPLLSGMLEEQRKTNELLLMLIQAMAEDQDQDQQVSTYMDGRPVL